MLKELVGMAVVAIAAQAQAQNTYQADQFRVDTCKAVAMRASNAWKYRETNDPYPMQYVDRSSPISVLHLWAIDYTMNHASGRDDAIKTSIAKCLDNVDKVYRYGRHGQFLSFDELN